MTQMRAYPRVTSVTLADAIFVVDVGTDPSPNTKSIAGDDLLVDLLASAAQGTIQAKEFTNSDPGVSAGTGNEAFGAGALDAVETGGNYNLAVGTNALSAVTTGDSNVGLGWYAGSSLTTGRDNLLIGACGATLTTSGYNVAIGNNAIGYSATGQKTVAIGHSAGLGASGASNLDYCVLIGHECGKALRTEGFGTTAVGYRALTADTTGRNNTAIGYECLSLITTETQNTAIGSHAAVYCMGEYNTYLGYSAGACQDQGSYNTAVGRHALYGSYNAGNSPPVDSQDSSYNTAVGYDALTVCTGGDNNVGIGYQCADNLTTGSRNIFIGSGIDASAVDVNDELNIGDIIKGDMSVTPKIGFLGATPVVQASHIADATDLASAIAAVNAALVVLENLGLVATS